MNEKTGDPAPTGGPCKTCGFLAVMQAYAFDGRWLVMEASQQTRDGIHPPASWVRCFRAKRDIPADMERLAGQGVPAGDRLRIALEEEHECWYEWTPYFDPQWHYEEWRMTELERLRQVQMKMIADVQASVMGEQLKIAAEHAETAKQHAKAAETLAAISVRGEAQTDQFNKQTRRYNRAFLILAAIAALLALAPLAYPNGASWLTHHAPGAVHSNPSPQPTAGALGGQ